jgi:hypothetical protein
MTIQLLTNHTIGEIKARTLKTGLKNLLDKLIPGESNLAIRGHDPNSRNAADVTLFVEAGSFLQSGLPRFGREIHAYLRSNLGAGRRGRFRILLTITYSEDEFTAND